MWTPAEISILVGWTLNIEMLVFSFFLPFFSFRFRRIIGYVIALLTFACLWQWRANDPLWNFELVATEFLIVNLAIMYFMKAHLIRRSSQLGLDMAINNYALAIFFVISQVWLLWMGDGLETKFHFVAYAILLWTVNRVITALLDPSPEPSTERKLRMIRRRRA